MDSAAPETIPSHRPASPFGRQGGLSLLEVVLTITILSSIGLGTSLVIVPIARQARIGREAQAANSAARRALEKIQAIPFNDILTVYPQGAQRPIPELPNGKLRILYEDPAADPLVVEARVSWSSPDLGSMTRAFHTIRTE